jgi:RNA polymerase sigma-70 factor (ECF subfamily)
MWDLLARVRVSPKSVDHWDCDPPKDQPAARVAFVGEAALVAGIRAGNPAAMTELHDRFARPTLRILIRILGPDRELSDVHHDVFVRILQSIHELRDPQALQGWVSSVAIHTARASIERRARRRRWLTFLPFHDVPECASGEPAADGDSREALRAVYSILDRMPVDDRIAFALRHIDGTELKELAERCEVSLATIKRRLARATARFTALAKSDPVLAAHVAEGNRWDL